MFRSSFIEKALYGAVCSAALATCADAASFLTPAAIPLVTAPIDDSKTVALDYDSPLAMHVVTDRGAVDSAKLLEHVQLVLKRPAARQAALDQLVKDQLDPTAANYHHWVSPAEFGTLFGPSDADVKKVVAWLSGHGFTIGAISPNKMSLEFSGSAALIRTAFKTELHEVVTADGAQHLANAQAPAIPAALSAVVHGVTLSNFFPKPMMRPAGTVRVDGKTGEASLISAAPELTFRAQGITFYAVTPTDFDTIYDVTRLHDGSSLYGTPITGKGVSVIVAEQTDINPADWLRFRANFGLSSYAGTLSMIHPGGCANPGFTGDEGEAALDAEWSSAAAPDASITEASCAGTETTFGVMTTLSGLVNVGPIGAVISISYGGCEAGNGLSFLSMWSGLVEQAASEGTSVFVSTGDNLVADCDNPSAPAATQGLAVNGLASNIYDTAVGGTDFSDTADGTDALYWMRTNGPTRGSALSYIPEIPWDNSCANSVLYTFYSAPDPITFCNSSAAATETQDIVGGAGGKSLYYSKPDWQSTAVLGVPNDGARGLPDVSLFAANGIWNHFYIFCMSNVNEGGSPCSLTNTNDLLGNAAGGTSFSAPIMAGIQAMVVQAKGFNVGNMAPRLYQLAQLQFSNSQLLNTCKSNLGPSGSTACVFHEVTRGDNAAPCQKGTANCYTNAASTNGVGVLSTSATKENIAYPASLGWNFATGLGTLDVTNLLYNY